MSTKHPKKGDLVYIDYPGTWLDKRYGIVLEEFNYDYFLDPIAQGDTDYRILLANPPENHPSQMMMRRKWIKKIKSKKTLDKLK